MLFSSTNLACEPDCWLNCRKQIGARAFATSVLACLSARVVAEEPVTQPPQLNPMMARATAPPTAPHAAGLTFGDIFMVFPFKDEGKIPNPKSQIYRAMKHTAVQNSTHTALLEKSNLSFG